MGTKGTLILSGEKEAMLFYEGKNKPKEATQLQVQGAAGGGPVMQASESRARDAGGSALAASTTDFTALRGYKTEIEGFCATIRNGAPNLCDGGVGMDAAVAILKGNEAIEKGQKLEIPPQTYYTT